MPTLKVVTAGNGGVGKTTFLHRYIEGRFSRDTKITVGVEFFSKNLGEINGRKYILQLWDFGGVSQYRFLLESYVLEARGGLLFFDLTTPYSIDSLEEWISILRKNDDNLPIILIGMKADLIIDYTFDDYLNKLVEKYRILKYFRVSAKTGENVDIVMNLLNNKLIENFKKELKKEPKELVVVKKIKKEPKELVVVKKIKKEPKIRVLPKPKLTIPKLEELKAHQVEIEEFLSQPTDTGELNNTETKSEETALADNKVKKETAIDTFDEDFIILLNSFIASATSGHFITSVESIINYFANHYNIHISNEQLESVIESSDGFSIGINPIKDPNDFIASSIILPWSHIVFYLNEKLRGIPKNQHDRLFFRDIRNTLYFPDHTSVGWEKDFKLLQKLKFIIEECNNKGYFLRKIHLTQDSLEIPVLDEDNLVENLQNLKVTIENDFIDYKSSFLPEIQDYLTEFKESIDEKLIHLIHSFRDKLIPEIVEIKSISHDDWDVWKQIDMRWRTYWNKMKKRARLQKILVLTFECPNCKAHFRFIYFEKTKFSKIINTVLKLAPWAYNILNDFLSGGTFTVIIDKTFSKSHSSSFQHHLLPDEITFLYHTLLGIEDQDSLKLVDTFYFDPNDLSFYCNKCRSFK
ncbi:hypothetical protein ES703_56440 [subsurface metagenome]